MDKWIIVKDDMGDWRGNEPTQTYSIKEDGKTIASGLYIKSANKIADKYNELVDEIEKIKDMCI